VKPDCVCWHVNQTCRFVRMVISWTFMLSG
jgi:hypothetical protein